MSVCKFSHISTMLVNHTQSISSDEYITVAIAPSEQPFSNVALTIASALYE